MKSLFVAVALLLGFSAVDAADQPTLATPEGNSVLKADLTSDATAVADTAAVANKCDCVKCRCKRCRCRRVCECVKPECVKCRGCKVCNCNCNCNRCDCACQVYDVEETCTETCRNRLFGGCVQKQVVRKVYNPVR